MSEVFISYSHKDSEYAHRLADKLRQYGIDIWIDERIDYGDQWPRVIQDNLNACRAFLLVMSGNSFNSMWVQNEVSYAQGNNKPIYPLLLEGPVWLSMAAMQYVDVRNGEMPPERFFQGLRMDLNQTAVPVPEQPKPVPRTVTQPKKNRRVFYIAGAVLLCAATVCGVAPTVWRRLSQSLTQEPPVQVNATTVPVGPSVAPRPVSPVREPSPTPAPAFQVGESSVAELYGLPSTDREMSGMWLEAGLCYDLDVPSPAEDPFCDAFLDLDGMIVPVNGAQLIGYVPDRSLDLTVCSELIHQQQDQNIYDLVSVPSDPVVCFLTNDGRYGFLIALEFDLPVGIVFDVYVMP
jgi:hypothetical protein